MMTGQSVQRILRTALCCLLAGAPGAVDALSTATLLPGSCFGDCNEDGSVTVDELVRGVEIALGSAPLGACPALDENHDRQVVVSELIRAVKNALEGCPKEGTVSGVVSEFPPCQGAMRGVTVVLAGQADGGSPVEWRTETSTGTDDPGGFRFIDVPPGEYTLRVEPPCNPYGCWEEQIVTGGGDRTVHLCMPAREPTATPTDPPPVCTAPRCAPGEVYHCPGACPGSCGMVCATPTPTHPPPVCTPPRCAPGEVYHCPGACPGGCGTVCATATPADLRGS